jgi:hypothetical protein
MSNRELVEIFVGLSQSLTTIGRTIGDMQDTIKLALRRIDDGDRSHHDDR